MSADTMISAKLLKIFQLHRKSLFVLLAFIVYYLTARLGLEVATINKQASPIWPATGVAISLIIFFGPRMAIGIFAGAFLSNYQTGLNIPASIAISIGNTLESLFFVLAFTRATSKNLFDVHNKAILGIFILILSAGISASVGTIVLWITSVIPPTMILKNWITWWAGNFLGALFIVPVAYKFKLQKFDSYKLANSQILKFLLVAGLVVVINNFIFASEPSLIYLQIFLVIILSSVQGLKVKAQKIAEEITKELREQKRNWKALTETSPVGIFLTDRSGNCTYVNPAWTKMTGLLSKDAFQQGWTQALHPDDMQLVIKKWNMLVSGETFSCDYRYIKPDGSVVYVTGQALPLRDDKQEVTGYFGTVQNITELYLNQIAVATSSRMSSLGQMASGIAHEINNPLTIIQGKALYLEKIIDPTGKVDFEKAKITIDQINTTIQRIAKIIKGLQSFSRDTSEEPFQKSQIKDAIEIALELCRERFFKNDTRLILPKVTTSNLMFLGSPEQISQVLLNLLNNAFDATKAQAEKWVKIEIEVNRNENRLLVFVSDSGVGVPPQIQTKIFEPFFTTKEVGSGTGLGLSISKGIMDNHKGRLFVDSSKPHTTFAIELPLLQEQSSEVSA
ncbi:MAG: ATP-binding protein [Bdellovibrionota bacterium]